MSYRSALALSATTAALGFAAAVAATPAAAQTTDGESAEREKIVVTARRREESLQDTPVAVTAFSGEQLDITGAADITAIQATTPNVTAVVSRGTNSTLTTFIRGVGQQDPLWGYEPGVGLYIDDVYVSRAQGAVLDIFDVQQVEVLRGPQGTLYGRNTIGGAIKYVTRRLDTDAPSFRARVNAGSYNQFDYLLSGSVPLSDTFAVGAAYARYTRDGYGENLFTGVDHYNKDVEAFRASAEWTPTANLFFRLAYDDVKDTSNAKHGFRPIPGFDGEPVLDDVFDTRGGAGDKNEVNTMGVSLTGEWDVNDVLTLKSITAYRDGETPFTPIDFDTLPDPDFDVPARYADDQFSQEFQAIFDNGVWSGVAGFYYLDANAQGEFDAIFQELAVGFPPLSAYTAGDVDRESVALYADVSYRFNEQWSVSVGGRYTEDETVADVRNELWAGLGTGTFDPSNTTSILLGVRTDLVDLERTDDKFTPRVAVSYEPNEDLSLYASFSQGFKAGGFDPRGRSDLDPSGRVQAGFDPETVDSYEVGAKGTFFDGALVANTALFFAEYTDQQIILQQGADSDADGVNDTFQSLTLNAGSSEYLGVEIESTWYISPGWTADMSLGWIDAEIVEIIAPDSITGTLVDSSDDFVVQNTPELTASFGLNYTTVLPDNKGELILTGRASYRDEYNIFNVANDGFAPNTISGFPAGGPSLEPDAYTLFDASAVWTSSNDRWRLGLHGKNLSDEEVRVALYNFLSGSRLGLDSAYSEFYAPPRTFTASVEFRY